MTVEGIKDAIQHLPKDERTSLAAWLNEMEYDAWDRQMAEDFSPGGRGEDWVRQLEDEAAHRVPGTLEDGFKRRRSSRP